MRRPKLCASRGLSLYQYNQVFLFIILIKFDATILTFNFPFCFFGIGDHITVYAHEQALDFF